jgi:SAM-dependent methyltransferase
LARQDDFESLIAEAEAHPFIGWDFSWISKRVATQPLPWDYRSLLVKSAHRSPDMLDLDTGGGELLAGLPYRPERTVATESYPPNVSVAAKRLHPLNVTVIKIEGPPDNNVQTDETKGHLPFRNDSFHLVVNRHASFLAEEVSRVLAPGGRFITQQVGEQRYNDFHQLLGLPPPTPSSRPWTLDLAKAQLEAANLQVRKSRIGNEVMSFKDIGAFAWYLKNVPWIVDGFSVLGHRTRLKELHLRIQKKGSLRVRQSRFYLEAVKENDS